MTKKVGHYVVRPGRQLGDPDVIIPVAEDLEISPGNPNIGIPTVEKDVDFYSREYPLESQQVENSADREWSMTQYIPEVAEHRKEHDHLNRPLIEAARISGELEPTAPPVDRDITEDIKRKAREVGFNEVGITRFDGRYVYLSKKSWVRWDLPHAICVAMEQNYELTQFAPSPEAEIPHFGTYRTMGAALLKIADLIRSLGYSAQVHSPNDNSGAYIPMMVQAGLGQLGANGQLLSPHFGSRARLAIITTDAPVTYDQPVDYGIHRFCQICQVCVNRCPGRALMRDKVWYRGVEKNKLIYKRCRPVMSRYEGCAVCMKVCPIQRYGMKPVMEHYVATGEVLGKGTDALEGYTLRDKGYFGPGELPHFDSEFFHIPHGKQEDWIFEELKSKLDRGEIPEGPEREKVLADFAREVVRATRKAQSYLAGRMGEEEA